MSEKKRHQHLGREGLQGSCDPHTGPDLRFTSGTLSLGASMDPSLIQTPVTLCFFNQKCLLPLKRHWIRWKGLDQGVKEAWVKSWLCHLVTLRLCSSSLKWGQYYLPYKNVVFKGLEDLASGTPRRCFGPGGGWQEAVCAWNASESCRE